MDGADEVFPPIHDHTFDTSPVAFPWYHIGDLLHLNTPRVRRSSIFFPGACQLIVLQEPATHVGAGWAALWLGSPPCTCNASSPARQL